MSAPDPLDRARDGIQEAGQATNLLEYSEDFDEPTGRTEFHVHVPQASQPEIDSLPEKAAGATRTVIDGVNSWQKVAALLILVAGLLIGYWMRGH